jgi:hypothetical protein
MKQVGEEFCGEIDCLSEQTLVASIQDFSGHFKRNNDEKCLVFKKYSEWDILNRVFCSRQGCVIKPDFLIELPDAILQLLDTEFYYRNITSYIKSEIICCKFLHNMDEYVPQMLGQQSVEFISSCIVHVLPLHLNSEQQLELTRIFNDQKAVGSLTKVKTGRIVSGSRVYNDSYIEDHLILSSYLPRSSEDLDKYFLIGGLNYFVILW